VLLMLCCESLGLKVKDHPNNPNFYIFSIIYVAALKRIAVSATWLLLDHDL